MIRKLLCRLGIHKWKIKYNYFCCAPDDYCLSKECIKTIRCSQCNYFSRKGYICEFCGLVKKND